jgi:hypothetical protein
LEDWSAGCEESDPSQRFYRFVESVMRRGEKFVRVFDRGDLPRLLSGDLLELQNCQP